MLKSSINILQVVVAISYSILSIKTDTSNVMIRSTMLACLSISGSPRQKGAFPSFFFVRVDEFMLWSPLEALTYFVSFIFWKFRFELNFAVNVLGTFAMTELMLPLLDKASPDARVITVSSGGMYTSPLTTDLEVSNSASFEHLENYLNFLFVVLNYKCFICSMVMPTLMGWSNMLETREFRLAVSPTHWSILLYFV